MVEVVGESLAVAASAESDRGIALSRGRAVVVEGAEEEAWLDGP